jgi:hypothetical protein
MSGDNGCVSVCVCVAHKEKKTLKSRAHQNRGYSHVMYARFFFCFVFVSKFLVVNHVDSSRYFLLVCHPSSKRENEQGSDGTAVQEQRQCGMGCLSGPDDV